MIALVVVEAASLLIPLGAEIHWRRFRRAQRLARIRAYTMGGQS